MICVVVVGPHLHQSGSIYHLAAHSDAGSEVLPDFGGKNNGNAQDFTKVFFEVLLGFWEILGGIFGGYVEGNLKVF